MTANAKAARGDWPSDKLTGTGIAGMGRRSRNAYDGTPHDSANRRGRQAAQREAVPLPESPLLTVDELCAELRISRSTFYDWRAKGKAPDCIVLPNGSLRVERGDFTQWLKRRRRKAA